MDVTSRELSKELYKLSGWRYKTGTNGVWYDEGQLAIATWIENAIPAYTLGYLLRKLPKEVDMHYLTLEICDAHDEQEWAADYLRYPNQFLVANDPINADTTHASTPENAAAKLAIELFKQGVLIKEEL